MISNNKGYLLSTQLIKLKMTFSISKISCISLKMSDSQTLTRMSVIISISSSFSVVIDSRLLCFYGESSDFDFITKNLGQILRNFFMNIM